MFIAIKKSHRRPHQALVWGLIMFAILFFLLWAVVFQPPKSLHDSEVISRFAFYAAIVCGVVGYVVGVMHWSHNCMGTSTLRESLLEDQAYEVTCVKNYHVGSEASLYLLLFPVRRTNGEIAETEPLLVEFPSGIDIKAGDVYVHSSKRLTWTRNMLEHAQNHVAGEGKIFFGV